MSPLLLDGLLAALIGAMALTCGRLLRGPGDADRIVALDLAVIISVAAVALLALRTQVALLLDVALALSLIAFLSTVALADALESRRPVR